MSQDRELLPAEVLDAANALGEWLKSQEIPFYDSFNVCAAFIARQLHQMPHRERTAVLLNHTTVLLEYLRLADACEPKTP